MATVNKSDRKKMVSTQVVGSVVVFHNAQTEAEITRIDVAGLSEAMQLALMVYGAKQIVADVVSAVDGIDAKSGGMARATDALRAGMWPRRPSAPASMEPAILMIMAAQGCDRAAAMAMLGLSA